MTTDQVFDHYCHSGVAQRSQEDNGKQTIKQTNIYKKKNSNTHIQVYIRLDTLEERVCRDGAWSTPGGSLFLTLMVRGKKVFDL